MSYEAWRREVELGRMPDWNEEKQDYDPPHPINPDSSEVPDDGDHEEEDTDADGASH